MAFTILSPAFGNGDFIPKRHTCDGQELSPAVDWSGEPEGTQSFALVMDDPDAPAGTWNHWLLWDVAAHVHSVREGFTPGAIGTSGKNDFGRAGYGGPCPPKGRVHRYYLRIYAVDRPALGLPPGATRKELDSALSRRVIGQAEYMGRYQRS
jgi:Raf kinase inhibitor-like YbhB/YbcL family protein